MRERPNCQLESHRFWGLGVWPFGNTVAHGFPTNMAISWGPTPTKDPSGDGGILDLDSAKIGRRKWSYHGLKLNFFYVMEEPCPWRRSQNQERPLQTADPSPAAKSYNFTTVRSLKRW